MVKTGVAEVKKGRQENFSEERRVKRRLGEERQEDRWGRMANNKE
jgi:hypothetical protein